MSGIGNAFSMGGISDHRSGGSIFRVDASQDREETLISVVLYENEKVYYAVV